MAEKDYLATRLFRDRSSAEREYDALVARGYSAKDINVIMTNEARKRHFGAGATTELGNKALEGAGVGGSIGAVAGGTLAAIAVAATVAVPGLGLLVAGPIAAALAGAGAGAVAGGAIGALVGAGIPEERVKEYESGLKEGALSWASSRGRRRTGHTSIGSGIAIAPTRPRPAEAYRPCVGWQ